MIRQRVSRWRQFRRFCVASVSCHQIPAKLDAWRPSFCSRQVKNSRKRFDSVFTTRLSFSNQKQLDFATYNLLRCCKTRHSASCRITCEFATPVNQPDSADSCCCFHPSEPSARQQLRCYSSRKQSATFRSHVFWAICTWWRNTTITLRKTIITTILRTVPITIPTTPWIAKHVNKILFLLALPSVKALYGLWSFKCSLQLNDVTFVRPPHVITIIVMLQVPLTFFTSMAKRLQKYPKGKNLSIFYLLWAGVSRRRARRIKIDFAANMGRKWTDDGNCYMFLAIKHENVCFQLKMWWKVHRSARNLWKIVMISFRSRGGWKNIKIVNKKLLLTVHDIESLT